MAGQTEQSARRDISPLRSWIVRHPIATFLVLVYATTTALVFVPKGLTEPGPLPGGATPHGVLENVLGSAVPAFPPTRAATINAGTTDFGTLSSTLALRSAVAPASPSSARTSWPRNRRHRAVIMFAGWRRTSSRCARRPAQSDRRTGRPQRP
jgi:hypothetical protein